MQTLFKWVQFRWSWITTAAAATGTATTTVVSAVSSAGRIENWRKTREMWNYKLKKDAGDDYGVKQFGGNHRKSKITDPNKWRTRPFAADSAPPLAAVWPRDRGCRPITDPCVHLCRAQSWLRYRCATANHVRSDQPFHGYVINPSFLWCVRSSVPPFSSSQPKIHNGSAVSFNHLRSRGVEQTRNWYLTNEWTRPLKSNWTGREWMEY